MNAKSELESFFTRNLRSANREKARARIFGSETETSISHRRAPQFFFGNGKNIFRILISVTRKTSLLIHSFHAAENGKGKERAEK